MASSVKYSVFTAAGLGLGTWKCAWTHCAPGGGARPGSNQDPLSGVPLSGRSCDPRRGKPPHQCQGRRASPGTRRQRPFFICCDMDIAVRDGRAGCFALRDSGGRRAWRGTSAPQSVLRRHTDSSHLVLTPSSRIQHFLREHGARRPGTALQLPLLRASW